jgi:hypothetical protein
MPVVAMVLLLASMNVASLMEGCRYGFMVACYFFCLGCLCQAGRQALLGPMSGITDTPILILCVSYIEHYTHRQSTLLIH